MSEIDIKSKVIAAQKGDVDALDFLMRKYRPAAKALAHNYFLKGADSEDLIQEAMIGLFKAIKRYDGEKGDDFSAFAKVCMTNCVLDAVRAANREKNNPLNDSLPLVEEVQVASYDSEIAIMLQDLMEYIYSNKEGNFSELERDVWAAYMRGATVKDIAQQLKKNEKSIYNALSRVKRKLFAYIRLTMI